MARRRGRTLAPVLSAAMLAAAGSAAAGPQDLRVEIDRIVAESRAAEAVIYECRRRSDNLADADAFRAEWRESFAVLIATLWATDFPADYIASVSAAGEARPPPADPSVEACRAARLVGLPHRPAWKAIAAAGIDFGAIRPMTKEGFEAVKAALAEVLPRQAKALHCWALVGPSLGTDEATLEAMKGLWAGEVATIRGALHGAGWPHDAIDALLEGATPEALEETPSVAGLGRAECDTDRSWLDWLNQFSYGAARETVEAVIAASPVPTP